MTYQLKNMALGAIALVVVFLGTIEIPQASAFETDDVDAIVNVAEYYDIVFPDDAEIIMNYPNGIPFEWIEDGENGIPHTISGGEYMYVYCNTRIEIKTLMELTLLHEGNGPSAISIGALVGFFGSAPGLEVNNDGTYSWARFDAGVYELPAGAVFLTVSATQPWTVLTQAGEYSGTVVLEIGPFQD